MFSDLQGETKSPSTDGALAVRGGATRQVRRTVGAVRLAAQGAGELLMSAGFVLLLFVAWQLWWTDVTSEQAQANTTVTLRQQWAKNPTQAPGALVDGRVKSVPQGDAFALVRIPRFGKSYVKPIYQGIELSILDKGVGHYDKSQMPGQIGNFAVAGHRVTYGKPFNQIATIQPGDAIVVETATTWFVYRAVRHTIVTPDHVEVVAAVPQHPKATPTEAWMTMTACHPEFSARERYVEFSKLEQTIPKVKGQIPLALAGVQVRG
jgi:sortase A